MEAQIALKETKTNEARPEVVAARTHLEQVASRLTSGENLATIFRIEEQTLLAMEAQAYELYRKGQFEKAHIAALGLLALDNERLISHVIAGDIALSEFRFQDAIDHFQVASRLAPQEWGIRGRLGEALAKKGAREEARHHLQAVLASGEVERALEKRAQAFLDAL